MGLIFRPVIINTHKLPDMKINRSLKTVALSAALLVSATAFNSI